MPFAVLKIDHIGIAVKNLAEAKKFYTEKLGLSPLPEAEPVGRPRMNICFFPCGDSELELLEPTADGGPIANFIESKGEGIHHIALRVDNIENALADLKEKGVRLIDEKPRGGAGGASIAFIHPKAAAGGVLLELSQK